MCFYNIFSLIPFHLHIKFFLKWIAHLFLLTTFFASKISWNFKIIFTFYSTITFHRGKIFSLIFCTGCASHLWTFICKILFEKKFIIFISKISIPFIIFNSLFWQAATFYFHLQQIHNCLQSIFSTLRIISKINVQRQFLPIFT